MSETETESQKAIRAAIAADQAKRNTPSLSMTSSLPEAAGDDCPGCHGNAGSTPCGTCGI